MKARALLLVLLTACGPGEDPSLPECDAELCTSDDAVEGILVTVVHAPDADRATLFSFAEPDEVANADTWDLGFARTTITVSLWLTESTMPAGKLVRLADSSR